MVKTKAAPKKRSKSPLADFLNETSRRRHALYMALSIYHPVSGKCPEIIDAMTARAMAVGALGDVLVTETLGPLASDLKEYANRKCLSPVIPAVDAVSDALERCLAVAQNNPPHITAKRWVKAENRYSKAVRRLNEWKSKLAGNKPMQPEATRKKPVGRSRKDERNILWANESKTWSDGRADYINHRHEIELKEGRECDLSTVRKAVTNGEQLLAKAEKRKK